MISDVWREIGNYETRVYKWRYATRLRWGRIRARSAIRAPRTCDLCHAEVAIRWSGKRGVCDQCAIGLWAPLNTDLGDHLMDQCADHPVLTNFLQWDTSGVAAARIRDSAAFYDARVLAARMLLAAMADLQERGPGHITRRERIATVAWFLDGDDPGAAAASLTLERVCDILNLPAARVRAWARDVMAEQGHLELDPAVVRAQQRMLADEQAPLRGPTGGKAAPPVQYPKVTIAPKLDGRIFCIVCRAGRDCEDSSDNPFFAFAGRGGWFRHDRGHQRQGSPRPLRHPRQWDNPVDNRIYCIICRDEDRGGYLGRGGWAAHDRAHQRQGENVRPLLGCVPPAPTTTTSIGWTPPPKPAPPPGTRAEWTPVHEIWDGDSFKSIYRPILTGIGLVDSGEQGWIWEIPCRGCGTLMRTLSNRTQEPRRFNKHCPGCETVYPVLIDFQLGDPLLYLVSNLPCRGNGQVINPSCATG